MKIKSPIVGAIGRGNEETKELSSDFDCNPFPALQTIPIGFPMARVGAMTLADIARAVAAYDAARSRCNEHETDRSKPLLQNETFGVVRRRRGCRQLWVEVAERVAVLDVPKWQLWATGFIRNYLDVSAVRAGQWYERAQHAIS